MFVYGDDHYLGIEGGEMAYKARLVITIILSIGLQGCVAQIAVGVTSQVVMAPFQVAGQVIDAASTDKKE